MPLLIKNSVISFLLTISGVLPTQAQTVAYNSYELWTRLALIKEITPQWEARVDINYRWQSNFLQQEDRLLAFPQSHLFRLTGTYRTKSDFSFIFSPFLYADNFRLRYTNAQQTEVVAVKQREVRFSAGVQKLFKLNALQIRPRLLYEYRHFLESDAQGRGRLQVHFQHPIYKSADKRILSAVAFNELFYNTTRLDKPALDQNRSFLGIFYQTGKLFEYQGGYQFTYQNQTGFVLYRSQFLVYLHVRF